MAIGVVYWKDGYMQQFRDEDKAIAIEAHAALKARDPDAVELLRSVTLPPSWKPSGYRSSLPEKPATIQLEVRGLDDIDTDPDKKKAPLRLTGDDFDKRYP